MTMRFTDANAESASFSRMSYVKAQPRRLPNDKWLGQVRGLSRSAQLRSPFVKIAAEPEDGWRGARSAHAEDAWKSGETSVTEAPRAPRLSRLERGDVSKCQMTGAPSNTSKHFVVDNLELPSGPCALHEVFPDECAPFVWVFDGDMQKACQGILICAALRTA